MPRPMTAKRVPPPQRRYAKTLELIDRAMSATPEACLLHPGTRRPTIATDDGRQVTWARFILERWSGRIDETLWVLHDPAVCNNEMCVNPHHLRYGTPLDNNQDKCISGTTTAKLSESDVRQIKTDRTSSLRELAARFGVDHKTIHRARLGQQWKHIT